LGSEYAFQAKYAKNSNRQLRQATEISCVVLYGGKTIKKWRTAAILKIVISPYLSAKSSDFDEILYTAAYFELDERHVIKNEKVALDRLRVRQNYFLSQKLTNLELWTLLKTSRKSHMGFQRTHYSSSSSGGAPSGEHSRLHN